MSYFQYQVEISDSLKIFRNSYEKYLFVCGFVCAWLLNYSTSPQGKPIRMFQDEQEDDIHLLHSLEFWSTQWNLTSGSARTTTGEPPSRNTALLIDACISYVRGPPMAESLRPSTQLVHHRSSLHQHAASFDPTSMVFTTTYLNDVRRRRCIIIGFRWMKFIFTLGFWITEPPSFSTS